MVTTLSQTWNMLYMLQQQRFQYVIFPCYRNIFGTKFRINPIFLILSNNCRKIIIHFAWHLKQLLNMIHQTNVFRHVLGQMYVLGICRYMWQQTLIRWYICIGNADTVWILLTLEGDPASEDLILSSHPQRKHIFMIIKDALEDAGPALQVKMQMHGCQVYLCKQ